MTCTTSLPRFSSRRLTSHARCQSPLSRCRSKKNLKRSSRRNQQYSITAITDGSGTVVERYAYTAYGTPTITDASGTPRTTTAIGNRYTYTGREHDETLALSHYRARMYDSVGGRFISRDPIGYKGSQGNLYEYVDSMPLDNVDPEGLQGHQVWQRCGNRRYPDHVRYPRKGCCNGVTYTRASQECRNGRVVPKPPPTNSPDEAAALGICSSVVNGAGDSPCCDCTLQDCYDAVRAIFRARDQTSVFPFYPNHCERWANECYSRVPDLESNSCISIAFVNVLQIKLAPEHVGDPITGDTPTHAWFKVVFCNGASINVDNGAMGGDDQIF
jgi:RHS repeat-associated protein